jgi:low temperature requirement protein LtrA
MAERCGLFIIIALGESVLVTGATFGNLEWTLATAGAFVIALVGSVAMWWIYFNIGAERASHHISTSTDPGRLARLAYTYFHLPLVAGIIVVAVADELILTHPIAPTDFKTMAVVVGGLGLYLFGNLAFKRTSANTYPLSHLVGLLLLAVLVPVYPLTTPLIFGAAATLVMVVVVVWETVSLKSAHR